MSNELMVKYKWQGQDLTLTKSDVKNFIATSKNVTDEEIKDFMWLCEFRGLNPFIKEAYLIKYGQERANIVTSKDVFDIRAFDDPNFDGEEITNNYKRGMNLMDLWVRTKIFHKGCSHPVADVTIYYSEYVGKKKDGTINKIWLTKPVTMTTKVSKAQGKREANPKNMSKLYLAEEFDQRAKPTESVIREVDITPKSEANQEVNRDDEAIEEAEVIEAEKEEQKEQGAMEGAPATESQINYIYGFENDEGKWIKGIVESSKITEKEVDKIGKSKDLSKEKASKILAWWGGDKDKNIIGEREKREKNPKTGDTDLGRREVLVKEVLALMKKNFIHKPIQKKMYKKYQKNDITELAYEELEELKEMLEHYVPDWK